MDERMLSRNLGRFQNDAVRGGPPERRTAIKRVALAIGGLQPGSLLFRCVHDSTLNKKSWSKQSISDGGASFFRQAQDKLCRLRPLSFELSSASNPDYIVAVTEQRSGDVSEATLREYGSGQKLFGRYTLVKILGRGGMGIVWLARDEELDREVALKFLPDLMIQDRAVFDQLKHETKRSLELTHPHIVRIYDFIHDERSGCISMEFVDGETLASLRCNQPQQVFEPSELSAWTSQICDALEYAHNRARIIHRDLKPANLMVNKKGDLKVSDFGIARSLGDTVSRLTMEQGRSGTLVYMSPQQLDGERGTHLDDIYSLGATLYELLTSKPPFYSGNIDRQVHERVAPSMTERRKDLNIEPAIVPALWEETVAACLAKDPVKRPQSATEVANRLQLSTALPRALRSVCSQRRKIALATAGVALCLIAIAAWYFGMRPRPKQLTQVVEGTTASATIPEKSIAVLPFENLGAEKDDAFFADGIQDDILIKLAKIADLKVISRTSVMQYRGKQDVREIGDALRVSHVLEGTVRRSGGKVHVDAQLVDTRTDAGIWAEEYDRDLNDVFAIEAEVAQSIANRLRAKVLGREKVAMQEWPTKDLVAYDLYVHATPLIEKA